VEKSQGGESYDSKSALESSEHNCMFEENQKSYMQLNLIFYFKSIWHINIAL